MTFHAERWLGPSDGIPSRHSKASDMPVAARLPGETESRQDRCKLCGVLLSLSGS